MDDGSCLQQCSSMGAVAGEEGPAAVATGGIISEGEKHAAADARPAASSTEAATSGEEGENLTRLSQSLVDYILSWEPTPFQDPDEYYNRMINDPLQLFTQQYIDRSTQSLRNIAEITKRSNERFKKFQDWARAEFDAKGCVEVDDIYIANRVLLGQAVTQEDWDAAMARAREAEALVLNDDAAGGLH
ncbi:hypothetical protein QOZ80_9BG0716280 [Eleusine coracana subsp. coracana]|nr:hypothetical protein QOZ80_9BG0716280 [Eleusine coracana subsp. coracana]